MKIVNGVTIEHSIVFDFGENRDKDIEKELQNLWAFYELSNDSFYLPITFNENLDDLFLEKYPNLSAFIKEELSRRVPKC